MREDKRIIEFYPDLILPFGEPYNNTHLWVHEQSSAGAFSPL